MMTDVVCHAKDFRFYTEGDREHFEFSSKFFVIMDRGKIGGREMF